MKRIIIFTFLLLNVINGFGQVELGQTKAYIINKNETCRIVMNEEIILVFHCIEGERTKFYAFDETTHLCNIIGIEFSNSMRDQFISMLVESDCKFQNTFICPIILTLKCGQRNIDSPAEIYSNDEFMFKILKYDLVGNDNSDKFGVYIENVKK